ncbi:MULTISPECIES: NAD(P)-dependent alcohol dehydrogenase [unclassified Modestobacter]|uniref:NAD(P)-dependent alcohol dehydrogenase n=1 Tax=unclassified Modestobacter TaxID=2643866 RepID=UPI0022AAF08D|nr:MULTISPECIES: NAD(P)-dependent alcohol dehydrogenase [unclassified Modestobacter]MCZ2825709.1 NAD(P)-dependent alcohol dehydrogenase [Modestobacter sp. VKM Ac-2981]MCZ2853226.1 NAD(P)-dependent alcohol dehydrogenase [Modestobacter sp. VKM Ac-2982]
MRAVTGLAAHGPHEPLRPIEFTRRELRPDDVAVRVTHVGVCHSDLHAVGSLAAGAPPLVPGHEFTGEVTAVGAEVTRFRVGDPVAVGNIVDSCGRCDNCLAHREPYCREFPATTYGGRDLHDGSPTQGAYSTEYVVRDAFVYALPAGLDPAAVAPLMCAGVTTWSPLNRAGVGPGTQVGVVGLGGLGHLAVKFAVALGARVTVFTTSAAKADAARALGAHDVVLSTDAAAMDAVAGRLDFVLDTASAAHDLAPYLGALRLDGTLCVLGLPEQYVVSPMSLLGRTLTVSGSGGTVETQEMLDFCGAHGLTADVEALPLDQVDTAWARLARGDVRYRFVLAVAP